MGSGIMVISLFASFGGFSFVVRRLLLFRCKRLPKHDSCFFPIVCFYHQKKLLTVLLSSLFCSSFGFLADIVLLANLELEITRNNAPR
jgi:hypothetical protein